MVYTFACTIGTFINEDWEIIERVIDFKVLDEDEHKGLYAGKAFADSASGIGGFNKISPGLAIINCLTNFIFTRQTLPLTMHPPMTFWLLLWLVAY